MSDFAPWLALLGPLLLLLVAATGGPAKAYRDQVASAGVIAFLIALATAAGLAVYGPWTTATIGQNGVGASLRIDALSAIMVVLVSFIGVVVLRYSRAYLDGDSGQNRFMRWLAITLAAVLTLIVSGNLALTIVALIVTNIGLNQLLLFYAERQNAQLAARKKFIASRVSEAALIGAAYLLYQAFGTLDIASLLSQAKVALAAGEIAPSLNAAGVLIVIAALLASAQLPLHGWLIEVMETPTPVSALLHAGIINAGGFLVLRLADVVLLSGAALPLLIVAGGATAIVASIVMLTQTSVKGALAWSTVAQMGFMMLQCGLGAFAAALLHIVAHSLYKAHAFLSSGSVIDLARTSWTPSPGGQPHPARVLMAILLVFAIGLTAASLFGVTIADKPGVFVLGAILMMGLVHFVANAIDERPNAYVIGRTIALAIGVALAWIGLQIGAEAVTAGALPATQGLDTPFAAVALGLVVAAFAALTLFQSFMQRGTLNAFWQGVHAHVANGFYLNTIINRWIFALWPLAAKSAR
jgi:NAD(P)H-quinone oxidoreductase subunit 5